MTQSAAPAPADPERAHAPGADIETADGGSEITRPYARERDESVSVLRGLVWALLFAGAIVAVVVLVVVLVVNALT